MDLNAYLTASGAYPDRATHKELTPELKANASTLLEKVEGLFKDLGLDLNKYNVSSGFRPSNVNSAIKNAAKKSLHQLCKAIDIVDDKLQTLAKLIESRPDLLKKHGLWLESPKATIGKNTNWVHLDDSTSRTDRPSRVFNP